MGLRMLIRWGGLVLLVGGLLGAISTIIVPVPTDTSRILQSDWIPLQMLALFANLFTAFGFAALYLRQAEQAGTLGVITFTLGFFGGSFSVALVAITAFVYPVVAATTSGADLIAKFNNPVGPLAPINLPFILLNDAGYILMSIIILRVGVFPRWTGWTLLLGSLMYNALLVGGSLAIVGIAGLVIYGLTLAVLGFMIATERTLPALASQPAS